MRSRRIAILMLVTALILLIMGVTGVVDLIRPGPRTLPPAIEPSDQNSIVPFAGMRLDLNLR